MKLTCWIIYNGFLPGDKFRDFAQMLQEAAILRGHQAILYTNKELLSVLDQSLKILNHDILPDYCLFTDKDIYLAKQLEYLGIPVFNSSETIAVSDDKIRTYQLLANARLPIPRTIIAPKTFGLEVFFEDAFFKRILDAFSFPLIIKETFGSFGEQVYLVNNKEEMRKKVNEISDRPFMFQEFVETSYGKDIRLQVVGNEVIAAMKRTSINDFRANVTSGGKMEAYVPNDTEKEIAIKAAQAIGADFAGIDLLFRENNNPVICEVNSNAHIRNLLDCTGINTAHAIISYIEKEVTS
ncbi:ATP-grasp domain-containing protein [Pseudogracilibacillus sp. SO30301A]|uniref:ATP-grasp domain-containing protein n=1 Tax=Pseudogracilibacillus sp. SO30301A TaxID=3098291 RepID=UPI00300E25AA